MRGAGEFGCPIYASLLNPHHLPPVCENPVLHGNGTQTTSTDFEKCGRDVSILLKNAGK